MNRQNCKIYLRLSRIVCRHLPPVLGYRLYHKWLLRAEGASYVVKGATSLYGKAKIDASLIDVSEARFAFHGCDEWSGLCLCRLLCKKKALVFEVGANSGTETLNLAAIVGKNGQVVSLEPEGSLFSRLKRRVQVNHLGQVVMIQKSVGDRPGKGFLCSGPETNTGMSFLQTSEGKNAGLCEIITLDQLCEIYGNPDFVWMDIEGYEFRALKGAKNILSRARPFIYTEVNRDHLERAGNSLEEFVDFVNKHRYVRINPSNWKLEKIENENIPPGYYHTNWLLAPEEKMTEVRRIRSRYLLAKLLPRF